MLLLPVVGVLLYGFYELFATSFVLGCIVLWVVTAAGLIMRGTK